MRTPDWGEKKKPHTINLTPTCWERLKEIAVLEELPSISEAIEFWVRKHPGKTVATKKVVVK